MARTLRPWRFVLAGGFVAGTLDIAYAIAFWAVKRGVPAQRILQSVAAGLLGGDTARAGGWDSATLGLFFQYFIATSMAAVYYLFARRWSALWQRPLLYGASYGLLLYFVMNYVVVPLSAAPRGSRDTLWVVLSIIVHVVFVGIPCAIFARLAIQADTQLTVTALDA